MKLHNAIEDLNKLALNKTIDNNIEKFFNEIKKLDDFKNDGDIIDNIKKEFLKMNEGNKKDNLKFYIIRDIPAIEEEANKKNEIPAFMKSTASLAFESDL